MSDSNRELIIDLRGVSKKLNTVKEAKNLGVSEFVVDKEGDEEELKEEGVKTHLFNNIPWILIRKKEDLEEAIKASVRSPFVVVECKDWKVIPLENLVAEFRRNGRRLFAYAADEEEVGLALSVLERGVDGLVVPPSLLKPASTLISKKSDMTLSLMVAKVIAVEDVGLGDRVCVDTASRLSQGEGMLVGSKGNFFFLVHGETIPSDFVPERPFRVNAGAVHSYVLVSPDKTNYLSELRAGSRAMVVDWEGKCREVVVGRVKIERRPLVMITAKAVDSQGTVMLQKAETIRLVRGDSKPLSVMELKAGDEILTYVTKSSARHVGGKVEEFIIER